MFNNLTLCTKNNSQHFIIMHKHVCKLCRILCLEKLCNYVNADLFLPLDFGNKKNKHYNFDPKEK